MGKYILEEEVNDQGMLKLSQECEGLDAYDMLAILEVARDIIIQEHSNRSMEQALLN